MHPQGWRCISECITRGEDALANALSPLRCITKYIHFCLFNKVKVIQITFNTMDIEVHNEILTFDLATFIGTAGGSLGLFLGFSLTGFAEQVLDLFMRNWFVFLIEDKNFTTIHLLKNRFQVHILFSFMFQQLIVNNL